LVLPALISPPGAYALDPTTFTYTGAEQQYTVPTGVTRVTITALGGQGSATSAAGGTFGYGATVTATVTLPAGTTTLYVEVGGNGGTFENNGGWNGGGAGAYYGTSQSSGGGGGASDVRTLSRTTPLSTSDTRLVVAGGGGGGGRTNACTTQPDGGKAGVGSITGAGQGGLGDYGEPTPCTFDDPPFTPVGGDGGFGSPAGAAGGSGATGGTLGQGGSGGGYFWGGGGGGGYFGGGGGGSGNYSGGGGGGGSSYWVSGATITSMSTDTTGIPSITITPILAVTPTVIDMGGGVAYAVSGTIAVGTNSYYTSAYAWDLTTTPPTLIDLGTPFAGGTTEAQAVDGDLVVGHSGDHAYVWDLATSPPTEIDLGAPVSGSAAAVAVDGNLAVGYSGSNAYAWDLATSPPTPIDLGNPLGEYSQAWAISGTRVVGEADATGDVNHAYAWDLATSTPTATDLTPLATDARAEAVSGNIAVGQSDDHAYAWNLATSPPTAIDLGNPLGRTSAEAVDGNIVVGASFVSDWSSGHAYAWNLTASPPAEIDLGSPLGGGTYANAISGTFVVGASEAADKSSRHAYVWNLAASPPTPIDLSSTFDGSTWGDAVAVSGNIAVGTTNPGYSNANAYAWNLGPTAPSAPAASLDTVGDGSVTIAWTAPTGDGGSPITGYDVYMGTTTGGQSATPVNPTLLTAATTSLTVSPLNNGTTYYFTVKARNAAYESGASNEVEAIPGAPSAPTALTVTVTRGKAAATTLSWTDHGSMITTHRVEIYQYTKATKQNPNAGYALVQTLTDISGTTMAVTGLVNKNTYVLKVSATNPAGPGPYSDYSTTFRG
jgi:hypothetical protein